MYTHRNPGNVPDAHNDVVVTHAHCEFFRRIPKVELHCHLFGAIRRKTFEDLNARQGAPFSPSDIESFFVRSDKPVGILHVLRALDKQLIKYPDDLYRMAYEYLEDAASEGVRHAEFFWNPTGTVRESKIPYPTAQDAIVKAIRDAESNLSMTAYLVASVDREAPPSEALEMVKWMISHRSEVVVGLGIDYRENDHPPEHFLEAYNLAREAGFRATAHAGEFGMPWRNVQTAVKELHVDRVDHGYTIIDNPSLASAYAKRGVIFTVVPTNSYYMRTLPPSEWASRHPIRTMVRLGLHVHPNTDDPTLHNITPATAWELMYSHFEFNLYDLKGFMLNGIEGSWLDRVDKDRLKQQWVREYDELRHELLPKE